MSAEVLGDMSTDEDDFASILRRNTYSRFSKDYEATDKKDTIVLRSPVVRPSSAENENAKFPSRKLSRGASEKLNPKTFTALNSFNDMGHLSRRIYNDKGENHLKSDDFENSFGYRKVFENKLEVTAITATTIANCLGIILLDLIVEGEKMAEEGHCNDPEYDIFCGGGKNLRLKPVKSESSFIFDSPILNQTSKSNISTGKSLASVSPKPSRPKVVQKQYTMDTVPSAQQITNFIAKLCNDTQMEYECIIISLIYVRRLIKKSDGKLVMLQENWKGIILSCIILANKVWDDFHMQNLDYCYVFNGLTIQRVNALEVQLLYSLDNRCNVSPSAYAQTHFEIQAMITMTNIEKGKPKKRIKRFSSNFRSSKVHAEDEPEPSPRDTPDSPENSSHSTIRIEHPSPYSTFKKVANKETVDKERERVRAEVESSTRLSVISHDAFVVPKVPTTLFTEDGETEQDTASERKKILQSIVQAAELEKQKQNLRMSIQYDEESIIKSPVSTASKNSKNPDGRPGLGNKGMSFKLMEHSRKSFRGAHGALSPVAPDEHKPEGSAWSCFPFSCMGKKEDVI
mmetsp:Transcript_26565/g.44921  ORF Transcript_26565/g.44921 Transcript_26565/m.44921 type:complete len:571 (+) Transcript_26565:115-1827(+)